MKIITEKEQGGIMQDKVKYIAEEYGIYRQLIKLVEEMSEVTKEITKLLNSKDDKAVLDIYRNTLPEELADLSLVYDQVTYLVGCEEQIEEWRQYKATREVRRIRLEQKN